METENLKVLKTMVFGAYDLQKIRIQMGLRLCANFRSRLAKSEEQPEESETGELSDDAMKIIDQLKESYKRLTDGIARNRTLPDVFHFTGDAVISTHAELTLIHQYLSMEKQESQLFRLMEPVLMSFPIYSEYLVKQRGVGPQMAAIIMAYLDPYEARHPSSFWRYAGLDVGPDGWGRSRREAHLIEHQYKDKDGKDAIRMGLSYNPTLKTKLMGVLGPSFLRSSSPWREIYDGYKHRILTDPKRQKITIEQWKKLNKTGEDMKPYWPPARINKAAIRYMVKMFLADLWDKWRKIEGLSVEGGTYAEGKLGMTHGRDGGPETRPQA